MSARPRAVPRRVPHSRRAVRGSPAALRPIIIIIFIFIFFYLFISSPPFFLFLGFFFFFEIPSPFLRVGAGSASGAAAPRVPGLADAAGPSLPSTLLPPRVRDRPAWAPPARAVRGRGGRANEMRGAEPRAEQPMGGGVGA